MLSKTAKTILYQNDGSGRDSYIYNNNGGNTVPNDLKGTLNSGAIMGKKMPESIQRSPSIQSKCLFYQVDGTGRDSYIHVNHGGLMSPPHVRDQGSYYVNSLRSYNQSLNQT